MYDTLTKALMDLIVLEPFYAHVAISLNKHFCDKNYIPTACVTLNNINPELYICEEFWNDLSDDHRLGLIKHEMLHICFFHLFMHDEYEDKNLFNIAADICINQYIEKRYLPTGALLPETFPDIPMEMFKDTKYYYEILQQNAQQCQKLASLLAHLEVGNMAVCSHKWGTGKEGEGEGEGIPDHLKDVVKKQFEHYVKKAYEELDQKSRGTIPSNIEEIIKKLYEKPEPVVCWKQVLKQFASNSEKIRVKSSRRKYNIRFPDNPAIKIKRKKNMLVAIDTSGSVSSKELKDFFGQILLLKKAGTDVDICECDTQIHRIYSFDERDEIKVRGRGGTYFDPPIQLLNKEKKYNSLIYFTDGGAPPPTTKTFKKLLWIITSNGIDFKPKQGVLVKMRKEHTIGR